MKKSLFMMGVAIAALSSCTQNEVLDIAESNTIQFGKSYIGKPTRATIVENEAMLDNFYVYAHSVNSTPGWGEEPTSPYFMENEKVYRGPNDVWGYDNIKKYENTKLYSFAAYSDGGIEGVDGKLASGVTFTSPTSSDIAKLEIASYTTGGKDKDLLVAISESVLADDQLEVRFAFKHALSQIKFTLHNPLGNNPIRVENFSVTGFQDNGTLTYQLLNSPVKSDIQWTEPSGDKTISGLALGDATTANPAVGVFTVIPQTPQQLTVSFAATLYNAATGAQEGKTENFSTKINVADILGNENYKPGYIYNFKMTLNMGYIYFDGIEVSDWSEDVNENGNNTDDDIEVPATPAE